MVELVQDYNNSISCQIDSIIDSCLWKKDDLECNATRGETKTCGNFTVELESDTCILSFIEGATMEDSGNYTCILNQGGHDHEGK